MDLAPTLAQPMAPARRRGPLRPVALASARRRIEPQAVARLFTNLDLALIAGIGLAVLAARGPILECTLGAALPVLAGTALLIGLVRGVRLYAFPAKETLIRRLAKAAGVMLGAGIAATLAGSLSPAGRPVAAVWTLAMSLAFILAQALWWTRVELWRRQGRLTPNVVVVGATANARKLIEAALQARDVAILGVFDDRADRIPEAVAGVPVLGDTQALLAYPLLPFVDRIVITVPASAQARVRALIERLRILPNAVTLFLDNDAPEARAATLSRISDTAMAQVSGAANDEARAFAKRVQDLVLGALGLVLALPVMAVIALAIKLDSPGPVFFRQRRHGFNNEAINVWKFRSMRVEAADATAARQVSRDDDRVTRVGRIIRKLSLDELPQLLNVVKGEMSLVGPRPHAIGMKTGGEDSARLVAEYAWRHRMKPGITGWAQVNGSVGAVDTPEAVRRRVSLDIEYIERQSFWFDLYILAITIPALIRARDAVR